MAEAKKLYRFLSTEHALDALQTKRLKAGRLNELNDPLDCRPVLVNVPEQGGPEAREAFTRNFFSLFDRAWGVLCYCQRVDDPVVWSHYADGHRGIALGFEFPAPAPYVAYDGPGHMTWVVDYPENGKRAEVDHQKVAAELRDPKTTLEAIRVVAEAFSVKAASWAYEKEVRQFFKLADCEIVGANYFVTWLMGFLREVVLGVRCPIEPIDIRRMLKQGQGKKDLPRISRARLNEENFRLRIEETEVSGVPPLVRI